MPSRRRIHRVLEHLHLVYLGLLPALATLAIMAEYGHRFIFLVFLGGTVAVSVYLAVVASYTQVPESVGIALLTLLDGPLCAALAQGRNANPYTFAIDSFLVDGIAIWLAIVGLAIMTSRPTKAQRAFTLLFALVAVGTVLSIFWPYLREYLLLWNKSLWLGIGLIEALVARYYLLKVDVPVRDTDTSAMYIVIMLLFWLVALIVGNVLYEMA